MNRRVNRNQASIVGILLALSPVGCHRENPSEREPVDIVRAEVVASGDWPRWGGTPSRNMVSREKDLPVAFDPGRRVRGTDEIDLKTTKNCLWVTKLGSQTYRPITVHDGKILVGTNNESPRNERHAVDRGVLFCLDEKTGAFLWQLVVPKLKAGKVSDWERLGIASSAAIDGDRAYVITNRCEVLCLDMNAFADGNQGFQDEAAYVAGPGQPPIELTDLDADIIWRYDMRTELGVFSHNLASSSVLIVGERVYATTSSGVDWSHTNIPSPLAPSLICLDKHTGALLGEEDCGISERVLHCSWSSPSFGIVDGTPQVFFGAGDGWCYGFGLGIKKMVENGETWGVLEELWRYDANPPEYRTDEDGQPIKYSRPKGPSEIIGTPVFYEDHVYVMIGQDPEHGQGVGMLSCIDPSMRGDISEKALWTSKEIERSLSTPSIVDDLLFTADYTGFVYCIDAKTGELYWKFDTFGHIWASTLVADGKVYIGTEEGELWVLAAGKTLEQLNLIEFSSPLYTSPVVANGVLYINTMTHLYAFGMEDSLAKVD